VDIRSDLSDEDILRIATVENVQRENLSPLEEAAAFAQMVQTGAAIEEVSAQTGLSPATIKRRLALASLCDEARSALAGGQITLAQAETLTLGTHEVQRDLVARLVDGCEYGADDLREIILEQRPSVALARFPLEQYRGTCTTDLFAEDAATYFDDLEQFFALQRQAVAGLAERYAETAAWVEVTEHYHIPRWHYRQTEDGETAGVLINLSPTGEVEILEGLARRDIAPHTAAATADTPLAPAKPKSAYGTTLCRHIAHHKSAAIQALLLSQPRQAREVSVMVLFGVSWSYTSHVQLKPHNGLNAFSQCEEPPVAYRTLEQQAQRFADALGFPEDPRNRPAWARLVHPGINTITLYEAVKTLSDEDLEQLHLLLTVLCFGQGNCDRLDTGDTLFNRVAQDLGADRRAYWRPDEDFLSRRTKAQLVQIATESGLAARLGHPSEMKKAELVRKLARQFQRVHDLSNPAGDDLKARDWLPDAMRFPAVDPDAPDAVSDRPDEDASEEAEDEAACDAIAA
jgi:ParB family chromosome partitioning protein